MRKGPILTLAFVSASICGKGQFQYAIASTPDSAEIRMNGETRCYAPCKLHFRWKDAKQGRITITVAAPGYVQWSDTLERKPAKLDFKKEIVLERLPLSHHLDSAGVTVEFDRLLAEFADGAPIGTLTDRKGKVEEIKWDGSTRVGTEEFKEKFYEVIERAGLSRPEKTSTPLFSDDRRKRGPRRPRYTVAARLLAYSTRIRQAKSSEPWRGSTSMKLEWQVKDQTLGKVVLTAATEGSHRYQLDRRASTGGNLAAFEDALIKFLDEGAFIALAATVPHHGIDASTGDSSTIGTTVVLPTVTLPPFANISDMINTVQRSCVTLITDRGHGSGAIIDTEGHVLSAYHVVDDAQRIEVKFADGLRQDARVVAFDEQEDVVILDISGSGYPALPLSRSAPNLGEELITIGTPADVDLGQSIARGILSGRRNIDGHARLQLGMAVSPGNSGGPLLNSKGEIVGVVQSKVVVEGVEGIGFALAINEAIKALGLQISP